MAGRTDGIRWGVIAALVAATGLAPGAARAQDAEGETAAEQAAGEEPSEEERTERARALFNEGIALGDEERWLEAAKKFRAALRLKDSPAVRYNLASALYEADRWLVASAELERIVEHEEAPEDLKQRARELLDEIERESARLTVQVLGSSAGVRVRVDDQVLAPAQWGKAVRVSPGHHEVSAELDRAAVDVEAGQSREVQLDWEGGAAAAGSGDSPPLAKDWRLWLGVSVGLAVLSVALVAVAASQ